jgi:hypothetical protein
MRIFLTCGHDPNAELVRRTKADLEKRGHDVWFDKNEIKFGDHWPRSITDGLLKSNRVLSFLSKHATRPPGVGKGDFVTQEPPGPKEVCGDGAGFSRAVCHQESQPTAAQLAAIAQAPRELLARQDPCVAA